MPRTVFITGASSGLGRQMAIEFARRGYQLALAARRVETLEALRDELEATHGCRVHVAALDVTDFESVEACLDAAAEQFGDIDRVVANAGIGRVGRIGELPFAELEAMIDTNVLGLMATVDAAVRRFRRQGFGHVVGISSVAGVRGLPKAAGYSASKAAVNAYLGALASELRDTPIRVTTLSPGYIDTPINQGAPSRPFCIPVEQGGRLLVDCIEREVRHAYVPAWPWALLAPLLARLPGGLLARMA
jgi:hypothetical protein